MTDIIREATSQFLSGRDLEDAAAAPLLDGMIASSDETALTKLFQGWNRKGITAGEIYAVARVLRQRSLKVHSHHKVFVDIVGTGGSVAKTFNVSTAAAFVVAGAGVAVAKHGNRAATSSSGSADVLTELGVEPNIEARTAEKCLNELDICFMFAPNHHRLSPTLAKVRRGLGFPTIFNCVGPLCNPANVPHQVIGVWSRELVQPMADVLNRLGTKRSWIVNGYDKLDEISMTGHTTVSDVTNEKISTFEVTAKDVGIDAFDGDLPSDCTAQQSAGVIRAILDNEMRERDAERLVLLNAAAAIYVTGTSADLRSAYSEALKSIRSGAAGRKLSELSVLTQR